MTTAICFACGAIKLGAFSPCGSCGVSPREDSELVNSFLLTDKHFSPLELQRMSDKILSGALRPLPPDEGTMEALRPMVRQAQRMLGIIPRDKLS